MEFFINHTQKQIEFAGRNAHLNKFLDKLLELVETKKWSLKDDIQLYIHIVDDEVRVPLDGYTLSDEFRWYFFPEEEEARMIGEAYDREVMAEKEHGERAWSGWDTPWATCDI
jgi:hypothetical protein